MAADDDMQTFRRNVVTNGDKIRQMTDEELANQYVDAICRMHTDCPSINCIECALNWLRKEAEP